MKTLYLRLPEHTHKQLKAVAARERVPVSEVARNAIDTWLRERDRAARHGAIAAYAAAMAGTDLDLDTGLEAAGVNKLCSDRAWNIRDIVLKS